MAVNSITLNDTFEDWVNTTNDIGSDIGDIITLVTPITTDLVSAINSLNNQYDSSFDSALAGKTTTNLSEGTNLYYTTARADSDAKNAVSGGTGITYTASTGVIATNDGAIVHDDLSGFVGNEHIDHTSVTLTAGKGLSGGGTIAASRSFAIDSAELLAGWEAPVSDIYDVHTSAKLLSMRKVHDALSFVTLDSNGSAQFDLDNSGVMSGINYTFTLNKNMTLINPTGEADHLGRTGLIWVKQDASGGRTLSWGSSWYFDIGTAPVVDDGANAESVFAYAILEDNKIVVGTVGLGIG